MKQIYILLFMVFSLTISAQELTDLPPTADDDEIANFKLYPNPTYDDVVYISTKNNAPKTIIVYDVFGKIVLQTRLISKVVSISNLKPGVYLMKVSEAGKTTTRKLVVK